MKRLLTLSLDFRPNELGIGFSLGVDYDRVRWQPNVWVQIGPFICGIERIAEASL